MAAPILAHLEHLLEQLRALDLDPTSIRVDRNLIQVTLTTRTEGQALADAYRAPFVPHTGNMQRFGEHRRYLAEPRRVPLLIHAVSFPHQPDWVPFSQPHETLTTAKETRS